MLMAYFTHQITEKIRVNIQICPQIVKPFKLSAPHYQYSKIISGTVMINQVRLSSNASLTLFTRFQIHPLHEQLNVINHYSSTNII